MHVDQPSNWRPSLQLREELPSAREEIEAYRGLLDNEDRRRGEKAPKIIEKDEQDLIEELAKKAVKEARPRDNDRDAGKTKPEVQHPAAKDNEGSNEQGGRKGDDEKETGKEELKQTDEAVEKGSQGENESQGEMAMPAKSEEPFKDPEQKSTPKVDKGNEKFEKAAELAPKDPSEEKPGVEDKSNSGGKDKDGQAVKSVEPKKEAASSSEMVEEADLIEAKGIDKESNQEEIKEQSAAVPAMALKQPAVEKEDPSEGEVSSAAKDVGPSAVKGVASTGSPDPVGATESKVATKIPDAAPPREKAAESAEKAEGDKAKQKAKKKKGWFSVS